MSFSERSTCIRDCNVNFALPLNLVRYFIADTRNLPNRANTCATKPPSIQGDMHEIALSEKKNTDVSMYFRASI
jgi:hypothetical protein